MSTTIAPSRASRRPPPATSLAADAPLATLSIGLSRLSGKCFHNTTFQRETPFVKVRKSQDVIVHVGLAAAWRARGPAAVLFVPHPLKEH
ncbi:MAG: hypothetical protein KF847_21220, partial [Pirellulales bacterium]|nr:hypothetical protein [Pirellulales bacterium]